MRRTFVVLGGLACWVVACGDGVDAGEIEREFRERAPEQYVVRSCAIGFSPRLCTVSSVQGAEPLESVVIGPQGEVTSAEPTDPIARIIDGIADPDDCDVRVETDPQYRYPSEVYFDCGEEGWGERVTCFVPDSLELERCL